MTVKHKKTGQNLKKIDRSKRKSAAARAGIDTSRMPERDARAVEREAAKLEEKSGGPLAPVAKQLPIPGTEEKLHKDIDEAAEHLASAKERHASAGKLKKIKEDALIQVMKKHKRSHYVNRGLNIEIFLESPDRVKLKQFNHEDENDE